MAGLTILDYPRGIGTEAGNGKHFLLMTSYESKNALDSVTDPETNTAIALSSIALYIPPNALKTSFNANYEGMEGGATKAGTTTGIGNLASNLDFFANEGGEGFFSSLGKMAQGVGSVGLGKVSQGFDKATGFLSAGAGMAVNNHMALVYKGPGQFRTHEFAFSFFPKNKGDADRIQEILKDFQNGMLPRMMGPRAAGARALSAPYFQSPRHWILKFCMGGKSSTDNPYLFKIKKSVITDMTVNHDQQSMVSLHPDGSPVQTMLNLTFKEIEIPISEDSVDTALSKERTGLEKNMSQAAANQAAKEARGGSTINVEKGITGKQ